MSQAKVGTIISDKMSKTVVVKITSRVKHPFYKKLITRSKKFKAQNLVDAKLGDKVKIVETRPISADVHFKVSEVIK